MPPITYREYVTACALAHLSDDIGGRAFQIMLAYLGRPFNPDEMEIGLRHVRSLLLPPPPRLNAPGWKAIDV